MTRRRQETLPLGTPPDWAPGHLVGVTASGRFRFDRLLGVGGIGEVYEAVDLVEGGRVAVKTLLPAFRQLPEAVLRFEREAKAGGLLDHPNIVEVTAVGALDDGTLYLAMELIAGVDVAMLLESGALAPGRAIEIVRQTLEGLRHAHAQGVLHRDLKPENLMVSPGPARDEVVKILDFGLVKLVGLAASQLGSETLTVAGAVFGTPAYMAPEQVLGRPSSVRTDLYALGVILFEMLTGRPPFRGADALATMRLQTSSPVPALPPAFATPALDALLVRALAKDPRDRFADAAAMLAALRDR